MLMRNHHRIEILGLLPDLSHPARQFPHAQTRIDQDASL
jgi:hypothetical protein